MEKPLGLHDKMHRILKSVTHANHVSALNHVTNQPIIKALARHANDRGVAYAK